MSESPDQARESHTRTEFRSAGTLVKPGPIGRLIRLGFGLWILMGAYELILHGDALLTDRWLDNYAWWFLIAVGLWVLPYVVNIGFTVNWKRGPQIGVLALTALFSVWTYMSTGSIWGAPVGWFTRLWLLYFTLHLGISFLLSAILSTPGCEMRAIPQLLGLVTGNKALEHHCPGVMAPVDAWELRLASKRSCSKD